MDRAPTWVDDRSAALLVDLYELRVMQSFLREGLREEATFSLFARRLPSERNFLIACGLDCVLHYLETVRFDAATLDYLATLPGFTSEFLQWLADFRFSGDVYAVPEGTPVFAQEPILEIVGPLPEAQLAETFVMNQVHLQTLAASKAARVVRAALGRRVIDYGLRRAHGADAGIKAARAFHIAGVSATSNLLAGQLYDLPVSGTMTHSYVQAHDSELDAFRNFARDWPEGVLLVDTYDTLEGVRRVVRLAGELGPRFRIRGIRLDSGDLLGLSKQARDILDSAGLFYVGIFASGGLDEFAIDALVRARAPIAGFGVGTDMITSKDAPALDLAYKLTSYAGRGRTKCSPGKAILPGRKQVFRIEEPRGFAIGDVIACDGESCDGRPLLQKVMHRGERTPLARGQLADMRGHCAEELALLPDAVRNLAPADPPYPVAISPALARYQHEVAETCGAGGASRAGRDDSKPATAKPQPSIRSPRR